MFFARSAGTLVLAAVFLAAALTQVPGVTMPSYETLDAIADSYNPSLALVALALIAAALCRARWRLAGARALAFAMVASVGYGLMFLERHLHLWSAVGLDYSTHTAVSLGLVIFLSFNAPRLAVAWIGSFVGYVLLMLYQRYHTISDIAATSAVAGVPVGLAIAYLYKRTDQARIETISM
jgi:hypothetical protein